MGEMTSLPSYQEATTKPHWLPIVAPWISPRDYVHLCLVDSRSYSEFAPRIWKDPVQTIRSLGLNPAEEIKRLQYFMTAHVQKTRLDTRSLVLCLDLRNIGLAFYHFFERQATDGKGINGTFPRVASVFPKLRCVLVTDAPGWVVHSIIEGPEISYGSSAPWTSSPPLMLTARKTATVLSTVSFLSPYIRSLVYLDLSYASISAKASMAFLPCLRILKLKAKNGGLNAHSLFKVFKDQLWSLDLSDFKEKEWSSDLRSAKLTDKVLEPLMQYSFPANSLRTGTQYDVEGRLALPPRGGNDFYGTFTLLEESTHSATFGHPRRHLVDPPLYTSDGHQGPSEFENVRHNGRSPVRQDTEEAVKNILLGRPGQLPDASGDVQAHDICRGRGGITHLHLNDNDFSAHGIQKMVRESAGQLEHIECDFTLLSIPKRNLPSWLRTGRFVGLVGASYVFRPVFSSNLQVLRVHHSLLTNVLSIKAEGLGLGESLWVAETFFEPRATVAYPQVFVPDMNPRLYSLTLTDIPRYSTGPLIQRILKFLEQLSIQERDIQNTDVGPSHRVPTTLRGLRHLHLDFGEDPGEAVPDALDLEDIDAAKLLSPDDEEFSFFGKSGWEASSSSASNVAPQLSGPRQSDVNSAHAENPATTAEEPPPYYLARLGHSPFTETRDEHLPYSGNWNGRAFTVPVWIGSGIPGPHKAVNEYMRLLEDPALHANVGPASPCHVLAGVPAGSYIYHAAWDAMIVPHLVRKPTAAELEGMRDVVAAIKEYRAKTKAALVAVQEEAGTTNVPFGAPHFHWSGKLEVSFPPVSQPEHLWR